MKLKSSFFSALQSQGHSQVRTRRQLRAALSLVLVVAILLPSLTLTVSAYVPVSGNSNRDYFLLYQAQNGDIVCRQPNASERSELEKATPKNLRQINHLEAKSENVMAESDNAVQHLTIILRATANLDANAPAKAAFMRAATNWENLVNSPVTIYIDADFGPNNFGQAWPTGVLGSTSSPSVSQSYSLVRSNLIAGASSPGNLAIYNALPATATVPIDVTPGAAASVNVSNSIARAIGLLDPTAQPTDGAAQIAFNSTVNFDFDRTNGVTGLDFESVATHEIGHALGFSSRSGGSSPTPAMWDLYRFRSGTTDGTFSSATRIMSIGGPVANSQYYFVPGATEIGLSDGGPNGASTNNADGNQSSHWRQASLNGGVYIGIMDPRIPNNTTRLITANDINTLNVFGYNSNAVPTPTPPANDNFASAQVINGCSGSVSGNNLGATKEAGEPNHLSSTGDPTGGGSKSVWYQWTAPSSGSATITTAGSGFDTVLGVYTGTAVNALTVVGQNDDNPADPTNDKTSVVTFNATAGTIYRIAVDGYNNSNSGGDVGPITLNWSETNCANVTTVSVPTAVVINEGSGTVLVTVSRTGDLSGSATVDYATNDNFNGDCSAVTGIALAKCDYTTSGGTLRFAAGEAAKIITISIVDDGYVEGTETFSLSLSNATGMSLGQATTTITINDNDSTPSNPFDNDNAFFVRQQYLDFLLREPDAAGFNSWMNVLNNCQPNQGKLGSDPSCDRVHVSSGFFRSTEFGERGYWSYRYYHAALGRRPQFAEFVLDLRRLSGFQSPAEEEADRVAFVNDFMQRPEFTAIYGGLTDAAHAAQFIAKLEQTAQVTLPDTVPPTDPGQPQQYGRNDLIQKMATGQFTAAQTLRAFIEQKVVFDAFFFRAFVAMQYFGYLLRDPEPAGYNDWVDVLTNGRGAIQPGDFYHLIFGFVYSVEYRQRFGP